MAVLTLNMRRVNKESSHKFGPGRDPTLNCLLQCPGFWPSCQFDAPFLHCLLNPAFRLCHFCQFVFLSLPSYLCRAPHPPPCSDSVSKFLKHDQNNTTTASAAKSLKLFPGRKFETSSCQNILFISRYTQAGERWKDSVFAGNVNAEKLLEMTQQYFAQGIAYSLYCV